MTDRIHAFVDSPVGVLILAGDGTTLASLWMTDQRHQPTSQPPGRREDTSFGEVRAQLDAYFTGGLTQFDLPLAPIGTVFRQQVWMTLRSIPYGETRTYGQVAAELGQPRASRAVGLANGRNPIGIIVPCHRVIGADGTLVG
ncbi:MAG: methylated-DNA--[protein]-cysteine S-methyltransferase, partial [Acidimicrobiales bacterium]